MSIDRTVYTSYHSLKRTTRTTLDELVSTISNHILHTLCPHHAMCELCDKVCLDFYRIGMWLCIDILVYRAFWLTDLRCLDGFLKLILCRLHEWRMESTTNAERKGTLCTCLLKLLASSLNAFLWNRR